MRGLQVWSEGRKRRVGAGLKGLPCVTRGGKHGKGAAAAAHHERGESLGAGGQQRFFSHFDTEMRFDYGSDLVV